MNIFNKALLMLSLTIVIPISIQAYSFKDLAKDINAKKKTIATGLALSGAICFGSLRLVDWLYSSWPEQMTKPEMLYIHPNLNHGILFAAEKGFNKMRQTINSWKICAACIGLAFSGRLIANAHEKNLFGENPKTIQ